jgi:hypothetical protein
MFIKKLLLAIILVPIYGYAAEILVDKTNGSLVVSKGENALVEYRIEPIKNPAGGSTFKGSNFIHPLKTPSGFCVTDSQPNDHPHHFGLWWPWK